MNSSIKTRRSTSVAAFHVLCELGMSGDATLADWECTDWLALIETPTFVIGAGHDTLDPAHMEMMARHLQNGDTSTALVEVIWRSMTTRLDTLLP